MGVRKLPMELATAMWASYLLVSERERILPSVPNDYTTAPSFGTINFGRCNVNLTLQKVSWNYFWPLYFLQEIWLRFLYLIFPASWAELSSGAAMSFSHLRNRKHTNSVIVSGQMVDVSADRKRGQQKGATSKNVKNRQKVSKIFSAFFDIFRAGQKTSKIVKKCQTYFRHFSTIFARHQFSGPFWGALDVSNCQSCDFESMLGWHICRTKLVRMLCWVTDSLTDNAPIPPNFPRELPATEKSPMSFCMRAEKSMWFKKFKHQKPPSKQCICSGISAFRQSLKER